MSAEKYVSGLLENLQESSDNLDNRQCYRLCAKKENIYDIARKSHQIIWGRRGTGKTTLLKAFTHYINEIKEIKNCLAIYLMISEISPTKEELTQNKDEEKIVIYIFKKLLNKIADALTNYYTLIEKKLNRTERNKFEDSILQLYEAIRIGKSTIATISQVTIDDVQRQTNVGLSLSTNISTKIEELFKPSFNLEKLFKKTNQIKRNQDITFHLETSDIKILIIRCLDALKVEHLYISLDEFSDIDKATIGLTSYQSQLAQLIKQVFLKSNRFSVKIATIWNQSKLSPRHSVRSQGLEYQEDIFEGPDLDIMFFDNNEAIIQFFQEIIYNTYHLVNNGNTSNKQKCAETEMIIETVFGQKVFKHLVCGSQGIARSFTIIVRNYLKKMCVDNSKPSFDSVFDIIIQHYFSNVRKRIAYRIALVTTIDKYIEDKHSKYFLISKDDYDRCEYLLKVLEANNYIMQFSGYNTPRKLRSHYKLYLVNYGNYLDSKKSILKTLADDVKLLDDGNILPEIHQALLDNPNNYIIPLPEGCETQYYCPFCDTIVTLQDQVCPNCKESIFL